MYEMVQFRSDFTEFLRFSREIKHIFIFLRIKCSNFKIDSSIENRPESFSNAMILIISVIAFQR